MATIATALDSLTLALASTTSLPSERGRNEGDDGDRRIIGGGRWGDTQLRRICWLKKALFPEFRVILGVFLMRRCNPNGLVSNPAVHHRTHRLRERHRRADSG